MKKTEENNAQENANTDQELIEKLNSLNQEYLNDLQRTRADFENFRKQVDLQKEQTKLNAKQSTILKILPLIDDLSRAIKSNPETLTPVEKTLEKSMKELGLSQINATSGTIFNANIHDAISMEDGEGTKEVIAEELRPGYEYEGEVVRPALVRVKHEK